MAEKLRQITKEELKIILEAHKIWLKSNGKEGERADLSNTNLYGVNLPGVNLKRANLKKAYLRRAYLFNANLTKANLIGANLTKADLFKSNLNEADLEMANLENANLSGANLEMTNLYLTNLKGALYSGSTLETAINVDSKYLSQKDIILDTENQIQSLEEEKKELQEKLNQASNSSQEEKEFFKQQIVDLEKKLEEVEEIKAQEQTKKQIEGTVKYLKSPNSYIKNQVRIQYFLVVLYIALSIMTIWFFVHYIHNNYANFKLKMDSETTFINWLFYASPLLLSFSLVITFINQINKRLQNIVNHNERKRQVDSIEGSLLAINALSINNQDARKKILNTMEKIIDHTLQSSEKANKPITLEDHPVEDPLSTLSKIKDLVK